MDRRTFLRPPPEWLPSPPPPSARNAAGAAKSVNLKKAVNLGMVSRRKAAWSDKFKMIQDAGFDGVELNRPDAIPLDESSRHATRPAWRSPT